MNDFNPDRINLARQYRGWTKKELADRCGIAPARITDYTKGTKPLDEATAQLFSMVTGFPLNFFILSEETIDERQLTFRKHSKMSKKLVSQVVSEFELLSSTVTRLTGMSQMGGRDRWLSALAPKTDPSMDDIERIAQDVRTFWAIPVNGPIRNVLRNLDRNGITAAPLTTDIHDATGDGVSRPTVPHSNSVIGYFPDNKPGDRIRFTVAHELGHLILHRYRIPVDDKLKELEAHAFAGALLMPESDARTILSPYMTLNDYAHVKAGWGVSIAALITRALRLGIIDSDRRRSLMIQMADRRWNHKEPVDVPIEQPILLKQMVGQTLGDVSDYRNPTASIRGVEGFLGLPFQLLNRWCNNDLSVKTNNDFSAA